MSEPLVMSARHLPLQRQAYSAPIDEAKGGEAVQR